MRLKENGFSIYYVISILALLVLAAILILPQKFNINRKENTEMCLKNMKTIYKAVEQYMADRKTDFTGDISDLQRFGYLKKTFECPEKGAGDKYYVKGVFASGEITVVCPNVKEFPDHVLPDNF